MHVPPEGTKAMPNSVEKKWRHTSRGGYSQFVREWIAGNSGCEIVAMMEAAEPRHRNDPATGADTLGGLSVFRILLIQPEVSPVIVIVANVLSHETFQVSLVENDDMIEQVSPATADETLGDAVLPRAAEAGALRLDAEALDSADSLFAEIRGAVEDQIPRRFVVRERLAQLLRDPRARRMLGDAEG